MRQLLFFKDFSDWDEERRAASDIIVFAPNICALADFKSRDFHSTKNDLMTSKLSKVL